MFRTRESFHYTSIFIDDRGRHIRYPCSYLKVGMLIFKIFMIRDVPNDADLVLDFKINLREILREIELVEACV